MPSSPPIPPSPGAPPNGWPACGRTTPASRTAPTARAGGRSIPITNGPGRPCWRSRTSWRACSRRRAAMPCARRIRHGRRRAMRPGAGRAAGGLRLRPAWHRRLAWRHRRLPQRHREIRALTLPDGPASRCPPARRSTCALTRTRVWWCCWPVKSWSPPRPIPPPTPRPFRVRGRHGTVQALGTRFTVREDDEDARVAVFEGAVEIRPSARPTPPSAWMRARARVFPLPGRPAHPGQRGRGILEPRRAGGRRLAAGRLPGRAGPLPARPAALRPAVADLRVSGVFPLHDTDRALHNLERGLPVAVVYRTRYWVTVRAAD